MDALRTSVSNYQNSSYEKKVVSVIKLEKEKPSDFSEGYLGGAKRDRTADLYNAIVALSQLSYGPEFWVRPLGPATGVR